MSLLNQRKLKNLPVIFSFNQQVNYIFIVFYRACEGRVRQAMMAVDPTNHVRRQTDSNRRFNAVPYNAQFFGHKIHVDLNEKLIHFCCGLVGAMMATAVLLFHSLLFIVKMWQMWLKCTKTRYTLHVTRKLVTVGLNRYVAAWNSHRIPGTNRGIPAMRALENSLPPH